MTRRLLREVRLLLTLAVLLAAPVVFVALTTGGR